MPRVPYPSLRFSDVPGELGKPLERLFRPLVDFFAQAQPALNRAIVVGDTLQFEDRSVSVQAPDVNPNAAWASFLFPCRLPGRPRSVSIAKLAEHNGASYFAACGPVHWAYVEPGGTPHVQILNVPGLPVGHIWDITFRVEWGG